jgi:very-short-patch-repair endonuclease
MVTFNLDEREVAGFLAPPSGNEEDVHYRVVIYETAIGGSGVLASLGEPGRLIALFARACELLHRDDPEEGCASACYECLLSFFNQRVHELLDRALVLPWLESLAELTVEVVVDEDRFAALAAQCQSALERQVLVAIRQRGLPLPASAQETLYDGDEPIAIADFFYEPKIVVFVDGSPHYRDYVAAADATKRRRLKAKGYRILAIVGDQSEESLDTLAQWLGLVAV